MKKILIIIVVIALGIWIFSSSRNTTNKQNTQVSQTDTAVSASPSEIATGDIAATVIYDGKSFSPELIEISKGDTVLFVNNSTLPMWVASDPHPMHTNLSSFDQLSSSKAGESYTYSFSEKGEWKYHNHMSPFMFGTIIVR